MTKIHDEKGRLLLHNWYKSGLVIRQEFGNGAIYEYAYDWAPNRCCPDRVVVTLSDSTKREVSVVDSVPEFVKNYHEHSP
jgi:hypothetical protein